ncbi:MAG: polysaccharide biosynthesis protein, partial [Treponema sp.]|nr:polysaccharide biosynthesis protein [Treponema sp.]
EFPPRHFFCVSTDKAANPVNIMGASKRIMEDLVMAYNDKFKVTTARFANVAFSNGSLPDGWLHRLQKKQPLAAPNDVRRYFVSPEESGQICMLACMLGKNREIYFPKLEEKKMKTFSAIAADFLHENGYEVLECGSDQEAIDRAEDLRHGSKMYPVHFSASDTTGEKACEEFFTSSDQVDMSQFESLGVVTGRKARPTGEIQELFCRLEEAFSRTDTTKAEIVQILKDFLPGFEHEEKGRNLDGKM